MGGGFVVVHGTPLRPYQDARLGVHRTGPPAFGARVLDLVLVVLSHRLEDDSLDLLLLGRLRELKLLLDQFEDFGHAKFT